VSDEEITMAVLNEDLVSLPAQWAKEFIGVPERRLLLPGTQLRKRVTTNEGYNRLSEWWILKTDWDIQEQPAAFGRARQAVRMDWQATLGQVVVGNLLQPVYGWRGRARWQPLHSSDPRVVLIGGGRQVCIPNLTIRHICVLHPVPGA
jgi:hypothetical protein